MENAVTVRVVNSPGHFCHQRDTAARIGPQSGLVFQHIATGGELHAEERQPVFALADLVNGQNVWMIETGCGFGLTPKTHDCLARVGVIGENAL